MGIEQRRTAPALAELPEIDPETCDCTEAMLELADAAHSRRLDDARVWLAAGCRACGRMAQAA